MSFVLQSGESFNKEGNKTASTVMAQNCVLISTSGYLLPAISSSLALIGILPRPVLSTDSDYAQADNVRYMVLTDNLTFTANVHDTSLIAQALVNTYVDLFDSVSLDLSASTHKQFLITGINPSAGTVTGSFNGSALFRNAV